MCRDFASLFQQPHQAHTPDEAEKMRSLRDFFRQLAGDDMEIDAFELLGVLNKVFQKGLGLLLSLCLSVILYFFL